MRRTSPSSQILFVNGLGFEGWMDRLEKSSGFNGKVVVASTGVKPRTMVEEEGGTPETITDPHAWQDLENGKLYVVNIRDALIAADPDGKAVYEANASQISRRDHAGGRRGEGARLRRCPRTGARSSPATTPSVISARLTGSRSSRPRA